MDLCGKPQLQRVAERVQRSRYVDEVMVITSIEKVNLPILKLCAENGIRVGVGSEDDVLDRYYQTARLIRPDYVIRVTGDCPCFDAEILDDAIREMTPEADYCSNTITPTYADGLDFEIIRYQALERSWHEAVHSYEREHVTQYIVHHPEIFRLQNVVSPVGDFSDQRWTVDEPEDYEKIKMIYEYFFDKGRDIDFGYKDVITFLSTHPEIAGMNDEFERNEGLQKSMIEDRLINNTVC